MPLPPPCQNICSPMMHFAPQVFPPQNIFFSKSFPKEFSPQIPPLRVYSTKKILLLEQFAPQCCRNIRLQIFDSRTLLPKMLPKFHSFCSQVFLLQCLRNVFFQKCLRPRFVVPWYLPPNLVLWFFPYKSLYSANPMLQIFVSKLFLLPIFFSFPKQFLFPELCFSGFSSFCPNVCADLILFTTPDTNLIDVNIPSYLNLKGLLFHSWKKLFCSNCSIYDYLLAYCDSLSLGFTTTATM